VNDLDTVLTGFNRTVKDKFSTVHAHGAVARPKVASDYLDQGRLAGAVVAHQSDHLPRLEGKRNVIDRLDGAEMFEDVGEFEN
jgi:hypothetical protein